MTRPRPWTWPALSSLQGGSSWLGSCGISAVPGGDRGRGAESALLAPSAVSQWRDGRPGTQLGFKATGVCNTDPPFLLFGGRKRRASSERPRHTPRSEGLLFETDYCAES